MAPFRESNRIQALWDRVHILDKQLDLELLRRISEEAADRVAATREELTRLGEKASHVLDHALDEHAMALADGLMLIDRASVLPRKAPFLVLDPPALISVAYTLPLDFEQHCSELRAIALSMDKGANTRMLSDKQVVGLRIRFVVRETPIELLYQAQEASIESDPNRLVASLVTKLTIATSVPLVTAPLSLKPEGLRHALLKLVSRHLVREVQIGDRVFDEKFLIYGTPEAALTLLTSAVRKALLDASETTVPELVVQEGSALLCWGDLRRVLTRDRAITRAVIEAAIRTLVQLRAASANQPNGERLTP